MGLTETQQKVVDSKSKRLLVLSCAGSGKTTVIASRIAKLWDEGVDPAKILALTFGCKAAREMKKRICDIDRIKGVAVNVKTFHAFGYEIIRKFNTSFNMSDKLKISRQSDYNAITKEIFKRLDWQPTEGSELNAYIKKCKSMEPYTHNVEYDRVFEEYDAIMKERNMIDMEDMLKLPIELLESNKKVRDIIAADYQYIFVDEYQDTNEAQNRILEYITTKDTYLCLVGDDDQAIYEWRGAKPEYIRQKAESGEYEVIRLETNFRSQAGVIGVANSIINKNKNRVKKTIRANIDDFVTPVYQKFKSQEEEADYIASKIKVLISKDKYSPSDIAVLYRTNRQSDYIKDALTARGIETDQYEYDENAQYSKFISVLSAVVDMESINELGNALNFPNICFDSFAFSDAKNAYCDQYGSDQDFDTLEWIELIFDSKVVFDGSDLFYERYSLIRKLHEKEFSAPTEIIEEYAEYFRRKEYDSKYSDQYQFIIQTKEIARNYEEAYGDKTTLKEFVTHLSLTIGLGDVEKSNNVEAVNLLTMHKSKGLEFKVVFIMGVQSGIFPNGYFIRCQDDMEAERRLFYVAITRAKELLFITSFKDPFGGVMDNEYARSGFMAEIPEVSFASFKDIY